MNDEVKNFIEENIHLIDKNTKESWQEIYNKLPFEIKSKFTKTILDAEINDPAEILGYIPNNYLERTDIKNYIIPNDVIDIGDFAFNECSNLTNVIIGDNVTSISNYAFYNCSSLESVIIGEKVTIVGYRAFGGCGKLTNMELPDSVTSIGEYAFSSCNSLINVIVGDNVWSIENKAFMNCSNLKNIEIPNSIKVIGKEAFRNCNNLKEITFKGTKEEATICGVGDKSFKNWRTNSAISKIICTDGEILL